MSPIINYNDKHWKNQRIENMLNLNSLLLQKESNKLTICFLGQIQGQEINWNTKCVQEYHLKKKNVNMWPCDHMKTKHTNSMEC
jgi:hypothetical protein